MSDERLEVLETTVAEEPSDYAPVRINRIKISNYRFFRNDFEIAFTGANLLIYGENGSGKSTIYRALEFLTRKQFVSIAAGSGAFPMRMLQKMVALKQALNTKVVAHDLKLETIENSIYGVDIQQLKQPCPVWITLTGHGCLQSG